MACLEHICTKCDWVTIDNDPHDDRTCPDCGARILTFSDEAADRSVDNEGEHER